MDWIVGEVDTNGESMGPGHELTPDERKMLGAKRALRDEAGTWGVRVHR